MCYISLAKVFAVDLFDIVPCQHGPSFYTNIHFFSLGKNLNKCIITNIAVVDFIKSRILLDLASLHLGVKKSCVFGGLLLDEIIGLSPIILFCHFTATCCQYKSAVIIK